MLSVTCEPYMLSVVMLSVIMLSVVVPKLEAVLASRRLGLILNHNAAFWPEGRGDKSRYSRNFERQS
jgi:hypothetical protein